MYESVLHFNMPMYCWASHLHYTIKPKVRKNIQVSPSCFSDEVEQMDILPRRGNNDKDEAIKGDDIT